MWGAWKIILHAALDETFSALVCALETSGLAPVAVSPQRMQQPLPSSPSTGTSVKVWNSGSIKLSNSCQVSLCGLRKALLIAA